LSRAGARNGRDHAAAENGVDALWWAGPGLASWWANLALHGYLSTAAKHGRNVMTAMRQAITGDPWMPPQHRPIGHHPVSPTSAAENTG